MEKSNSRIQLISAIKKRSASPIRGEMRSREHVSSWHLLIEVTSKGQHCNGVERLAQKVEIECEKTSNGGESES
jgi:hypothetical protein